MNNPREMPVFLLPPGSTLNALIMWCNDHMQVSFRIKFVTGLLGDGHLDLFKLFHFPKIPKDVYLTVVVAKTVLGERRFFATF